MSQKITSEVLNRYLNGTCSPEEKVLVEDFYDSLKGESDFLATLSSDEQLSLQSEVWNQINTQTHSRRIPHRLLYFTTANWIKIAASIIVLIGLIGYFWHSPSSHTNLAAKPTINLWKTFENTQNKVVKHTFSDGSSVWLHPHARVEYPTKFAGKQRRIVFSGEGFFDITKDPQHPFIIKTQKVQIAVLGTSFNVKTSSLKSLVEVDVVTGKVAVNVDKTSTHQPQAAVVLTPGQKVVYSEQTPVLAIKVVKTEDTKLPIYQPISISFDNTTISEIINVLEKKFDVRFKMANPQIGNCRITADFDNEHLPLILSLLCETSNLTYSIENKQVILAGEGCN